MFKNFISETVVYNSDSIESVSVTGSTVLPVSELFSYENVDLTSGDIILKVRIPSKLPYVFSIDAQTTDADIYIGFYSNNDDSDPTDIFHSSVLIPIQSSAVPASASTWAQSRIYRENITCDYYVDDDTYNYLAILITPKLNSVSATCLLTCRLHDKSIRVFQPKK